MPAPDDEMSCWTPPEPERQPRIGGGFYGGLLLALCVGLPLWLGIWWLVAWVAS